MIKYEKTCAIGGQQFGYLTGEGWVPIDQPVTKVINGQKFVYAEGKGWVFADEDSRVLERNRRSEEEIRKRERLLAIQARERGFSDESREDVLQEGRISLWQTLEKHDGDVPPQYLNRASELRMREVATRETWTGHTRKHGQPTDPLRNHEKQSMDDEAFSLGVLEVVNDVLSGVEMAYHHGEIVQAINALPEREREYVVLRFWGGYTLPEIADVLSISKQHIERTWRERTRPVLRSHLEHLVGAL